MQCVTLDWILDWILHWGKNCYKGHWNNWKNGNFFLNVKLLKFDKCTVVMYKDVVFPRINI